MGLGQNDIPIGTWRTHYAYYNLKHVVEAENRIFASAESGLFYFDKDDNSITKLSKIDGLQAEDITALYFDHSTSQLLIGYGSGNLDVIRGNEIFSLDLTSTSQIIGSKRINHITSFQSFAYIATDYGVLKFDLSRLEVTETYRELGAGAEPLKINQSTVLNDSLFLATEEGVLAANLIDGTNLLDYQNWKRFDIAEGIPASPIQIIVSLNNIVLAGIDEDQLYKYEDIWQATGLLMGADFSEASSNDQQALIVHSGALTGISLSLQQTSVQSDLLSVVSMAINDQEGHLWIADAQNGLITDYTGAFQSLELNGPYKNEIFRFGQFNNSIYAFPGGYASGMNPMGSDAGFYIFSGNSWQNYNIAGIDYTIPEFKDIVDGAYQESSGSLFLASAGYGLLKLTNNGESTIIDEINSPLENLSVAERRVIIPALTKANGGLWVLNYGAAYPLHFLDKDGNWASYNLNLTAASYPIKIMIVNHQVWMIIDPTVEGGILVFEPETNEYRFLSDVTNNGGLKGDRVYDFALDKEGLVWVGTNDGVSVFTLPSEVLEGNVDAVEPIFENGLLFRNEDVLCIEIDGGNRKWIGTTKGAWLFNDAADEQILHFDQSNSPLPDNRVFDIEINTETGEVFFATNKGIVSYRGTATEAREEHSDVKIFPNPVTEDFNGTVGISGLASDAVVKITDISGKLIWQMQANGGTATWNVSDYNGNRAESGIYLVFSASEDGEDTFVGKIAVIN
ncbi:T9SS type A sorting domain-containing protein [Fulvivirga ulvae]|nr:two-component regulator propeller domain-containing protein [Fulvivirga ulvae]UII34779.1 T9SS type A sorting domain-containing protein [Fulvivirga ulvae]